jgi:dihydroorotase
MISSYLVKGANILSVINGEYCQRDILVENGIVTEVDHCISENDAQAVLEAKDLTVTPGWVDSHAHLFDEVGYMGVDPQMYHLPQGVTYAIDQGTAGANNFDQFNEHTRYRSDIRYKSFLNISQIGMPIGGYELVDEANINRKACLKTCQAHSEEILGLKLRVGNKMCTKPINAMKATIELAEELQAPIVIHATRCRLETEDIMKFLRPGDIFTHTYARTDSGILNRDGRIKDCVWKARERGVRFDLGHGINSFSFEVAEKAIKQNFWIDTISTDLHIRNIRGPVFNMPITLSKFLMLGMSLEKAIYLVTVAPVKMFGIDDKSLEIEVGEMADFTAFKVEPGRFQYVDSDNAELIGDKRVVSIFTAVGSKIFINRKVSGKNTA